LELFLVEISSTEGRALFLDAVEKMGSERAGVPFLVIGNRYLIGTLDIPEQFPGLIEYHLAEGGVVWPDLPGLAEYMSDVRNTQIAILNPSSPSSTEPSPTRLPVEATPTAAESTLTPQAIPSNTPVPASPSGESQSSLKEKLARDPIGNGLAILVLIGMLITLGWGIWLFVRKPGRRFSGFISWSVPLLCLIGLGVAGYLSYVETSQVEAYCGLVGDCNTVQQSEYARLFGILPIGILGLLGYVLILVAWAVSQFGQGKWQYYATLAQLTLTTFATLFSIYLTFLEPFVIGATCLWCLSSAVISTLLMVLSVPPGKLAWHRLAFKNP